MHVPEIIHLYAGRWITKDYGYTLAELRKR